MSTNTHEFTDLPLSAIRATSPGGYTIAHLFQRQEDDETNEGQYEESVAVDWWEDIPRVVESMLNYPDSSGFTVSITITANNAQ